MSDQETAFNEANRETIARDKMVRGSIWMTLGSVISRLLGAIYIVPWCYWMGENQYLANTLFNKGYNIYALFLMIATAGIPAAIAKQISHYNSQNEYGISHRLFKRTLVIMAGLGVIFAGIMYFISPILADGDKNLIPVMRALSIAVLVFPCMSVIRGYFQGNENMMPSAVSQVVEQIIRVFYMLLATFIIIKVNQGNYVDAVVQSTFAAFVGMLAAFGALFWFYAKQKPQMDQLIAESSNVLKVSENSLVKRMIKEAIPFIIVGSGVTLFKLVDQFTFERMLGSFTNYSKDELSTLLSIFSANPDKLVMIVISLATGMAMTSLPLITEAFTKKDETGLAKLVSDNIQLMFLVMIPATFGLMILARPMYAFFYTPNPLGVNVLIEACLSGLVMGYSIMILTTVQGLYHNIEAVAYLGVGLVIKMLIQYPLIRQFEVYGPLIATTIGFTVTCYLTTRRIHQVTKFNYSLTMRRILLIFIFSLVMAFTTFLAKSFLYLFLDADRKFQAMLIVLICIPVGMVTYGWLILKTRLADKLLGPKIKSIRKKLNIK